MIIGGIELGGTKIVCGIGNEKGQVLDRFVFPTTTPRETLSTAVSYFKDRKIETLGIGSFGPIDLNEKSNMYGHILKTPKQGWEYVDVLSAFSQLNVPTKIDTDVNAACIGEVKYGAGVGVDNVVYVTIGTGIGFGVFLNGQTIHGLLHPEFGHMLLKMKSGETYKGVCLFHDCCLEGLANGPAIEKRWGSKGELLQDKKEVWDLEAYYLGQAMANCIMAYSPEKIILGGGVMHNKELIKLVRKETLQQLNNYIQKDEIINNIDNYIVLAKLKDDAGLIGSIELGRLALANE